MVAVDLPKCAARVTGRHLRHMASKSRMMSHNNQEVSRNSYLHAGQRDAAAVSQLWQQLWMLEGSLAHLQTVTNVHAQGAVEGRSGGRAQSGRIRR